LYAKGIDFFGKSIPFFSLTTNGNGNGNGNGNDNGNDNGNGNGNNSTLSQYIPILTFVLPLKILR